MREAGSTLAERREQQRGFVPLGNGGGDTLRHGDMAVEAGLHSSIASDVVGVRVGVDQARQAPTIERTLKQRQRLRCVADIATINQRCLIAFKENDVVRGEPAALEHQNAVR